MSSLEKNEFIATLKNENHFYIYTIINLKRSLNHADIFVNQRFFYFPCWTDTHACSASDADEEEVEESSNRSLTIDFSSTLKMMNLTAPHTEN